MAHQFDKERYGQRQGVKNRFSFLKKKFSGDLKAREYLIQMKEIAVEMIVCNLHTFSRFLLFRVFYIDEGFKMQQ